MTLLGFLNSLGTWNMVIILVVGLLIFGKRLPDLGRTLGKGLVEFKKGLAGAADEPTTAPEATNRAYLERRSAGDAPVPAGPAVVQSVPQARVVSTEP